MIIVEGMDNSGKTTLCNRLSQRLSGIPILHSIKPADSDDALALIFSQISSTEPVIYDRSTAISEPIYGPIIRGKSLVDWPKVRVLETLAQRGMLVIYCRPPDATILNFDGREQMDGVVERARQLIPAYDEMFSLLTLLAVDTTTKVLKYDYTQDELFWPLIASTSDWLLSKWAARHHFFKTISNALEEIH